MISIIIAAVILLFLALVFVWHAVRTLGDIPLQSWHVAFFLLGLSTGLFCGGLAISL